MDCFLLVFWHSLYLNFLTSQTQRIGHMTEGGNNTSNMRTHAFTADNPTAACSLSTRVMRRGSHMILNKSNQFSNGRMQLITAHLRQGKSHTWSVGLEGVHENNNAHTILINQPKKTAFKTCYSDQIIPC